MFDLQIIGTKIVRELGELIDQKVVVIDHNGFIIASTDMSRMNQFHEGALLAMKSKEVMHMTKELSAQLKGVLEGMVMPLIIEDTPIGVIGVTGQPEEIEKYGKLVQKITQFFVEDFLMHRKKERETKMFELFLLDLLNGQVHQALLEQRAEMLNIDTALYNRVIIIQLNRRIDEKGVDYLRAIQIIHPQLHIFQWSFDKLVLLVPKVTRMHLEETLYSFNRKLSKLYDNDIFIGVGNSHSFFKLNESYNEASNALTVAIENKQIVFEEDLKLELLLSDLQEQKVDNFIERTIGSLIGEEELIYNLEIWLKSKGALQDIADMLHIHKNTLKYRLKKIEKLLNIDINNNENKLELMIAILLYRKKRRVSL
ncbi:sugar diacid recognition domain-containing protein [Lysinibacillus sp. FSL K6-0232]|uniref:CdaR family transcriptional regulator n=1 Tax=unclassified Lysinibacillus TaxID=2636778 RepID=UPI0030F71BFF